MFLGTYQPNLIGKGRIALPKKIRNAPAGEHLVLTLGFEKCIYGFGEKEWEEIVKPELNRPLFSDEAGRDLRRKMFAGALPVDLDSQGRFVIPEAMTEYAGIKEKLVIIGAGDHFEVWDIERWEKYRQKMG